MPKSWRDTVQIHPAADEFPPMPPDELRALGEDIKKNGLTSPIVLWRADDGAPVFLLDGRSRLDAIECTIGRPVEIVLEETYPEEWTIKAGGWDSYGDVIVLDRSVDPYAYVISANIHRRHLKPDKKRELIAKLVKAQLDKSALQISKMAKSSPHTVIKVRDDLVAKGDVCKVQTSVDTKGRQQPTRRKPWSRDRLVQTRVDARAKQNKALEAVAAQRARNDIGPASPGELERKEAEIDAVDDDAAQLGALLRAWDRASAVARERFLTRTGLQSPPGDMPDFLPFLRRTVS